MAASAPKEDIFIIILDSKHGWSLPQRETLSQSSEAAYTQRAYMCVRAQACRTLCNSVDCSPLGSSVHEISQARILEWVAMSFSRESSWPRDQTCVSCIVRKVLHH